MEARIDSGMEIVMIRVLRQLPRNSNTISAGQRRCDDGFGHDALDRAADENRLIACWQRSMRRRAAAREPWADASLISLTMLSVEAEPVF